MARREVSEETRRKLSESKLGVKRGKYNMKEREKVVLTKEMLKERAAKAYQASKKRLAKERAEKLNLNESEMDENLGIEIVLNPMTDPIILEHLKFLQTQFPDNQVI